MSHADDDVDMLDLEDEASRAAEAVRATLQSFRSSKHRPGSSAPYESDPREWLRRDTEDYVMQERVSEDMESDSGEEGEDDSPTLARLTTPPQRQSLLQRSNTPVMSNQSKPPRRTPLSASSTETNQFHSPLSSPLLSPALSSRSIIIQRSIPSSASSHVEYQRFYEATVRTIQAQRQLAERRARITREEYAHRSLAVELEFLQALRNTCWDVGTLEYQKQGNLWSLMATLRRLGTSWLLWDDAPDAKQRRQVELEAFKEELAAQVEKHPRALVDATLREDAPAWILRHRAIIRWLEAWFHYALPSGVTRPRQVRYLEDSHILKTQGLPETDKDAELFGCSLALLLAGRVSDIQTLWKESNVPWRAALFSGEEPLGYEYRSQADTQTVGYHVTGNERRPLWRRYQWIKAEKMAEQQIPVACVEQSAIHAVLGCNLQAALRNPAMRSWERGLYVTFRSVMARLEDEILHRHNNRRRALGPFPATQYEKSECEHLAATSDYANWDERQILEMLQSTPYPQMQSDDLPSRMVACLLIGKTALHDFLLETIQQIERQEISDDSNIRLMVHVLLYLDMQDVDDTSLKDKTSFREYKNRALQVYLSILATRDDLWYLRVLYASLMPHDSILENLPTLLMSIESLDERTTVVEQLRDYLPAPGLDKEVLRLLVGNILSQDSYADVDSDTPTPLDIQKMEGIKWLCLSRPHLDTALEFTNALLRQFLLADKVASAQLFVDDVLRGKDECERKILEFDAFETGQDGVKDPHDLKGEYEAYTFYLKAKKDFIDWEETIAAAMTRPVMVDDQVDASLLDSTSAAIARQMQHRELVSEKRSISNRVKAVAHRVQESLLAVLKCPGGWLSMADDDSNADSNAMVVRDSNDGFERNQLRSKILPKVVMSYYKLCADTATWMSESLNDAMERLGGKSHSTILMTLDDSYSSSGSAQSALAPWYWTAHALDLADTIVSETYDILPACDVVALKQIAEKASEIAVDHLMYESVRS